MSTLKSEDWKIEKRGKSCHACARAFDSEEVHYSGIAEVRPAGPDPAPGGNAPAKPAPRTEEEPAAVGFERRDYCVPCWEKKPELFSFWKTRMPKLEEKRLEDINAMVEFFRRLIEGPLEDPFRAKIAYLTALLLARKRRVRLVGSAGGRLKIEKTWDGEAAAIPEPVITDDELAELRTRMEELFEIELGSGDLPKPRSQG